jgi:alpha-glucosidase
MNRSSLLVAILVLQGAAAGEPHVEAVSAELRDQWKLSSYYEKHVDLCGFPLLSSGKVSDEGLLEAAYLIEKMLDGRDDIRRALIDNKVRFVVMAPDEKTTDVPEHSDLTPKDYWDRRARGLGATVVRPAVSCGEENLLNLPGDRYAKENILVHEFAHAIHEMALSSIDKHFDQRLKECFDAAVANGLWKGTYAATNYKEYWAEAVQTYFECNNPADFQHNDIDTRKKLAQYDPKLFALIDKTFNRTRWRYERYDQRKPAAIGGAGR